MRSIQYESKKALSQSEIKSILRGVRNVNRSINEGTAIRKGNMVDTLITNPEMFESLYKETVIPIVKTPKIRQLIDSYVDYGFNISYDEEDYMDTDNIVYFCKKVFGHYTKYKDKTLIDTLNAAGALQYLKYILNKEEDVNYVDATEVELARAITTSLQLHEHSRFYCKNKKEYAPDIDVYDQEEIYFTYSHTSESGKNYELPAKALVDRIIVDNTNKIIYPIDIKTTDSPTGLFPKKILDFRYDIQAYWYTYAITNQWVIDKEISDYEIDSFSFVVENSGSYIGRPLVWKLSELDMKVAHLGIENGLPGVKQALDLYLWHTINNEWSEDKIVLENNGVLETSLHARQVLP